MERKKFQEPLQVHCYEKRTGPELEKALRSYGSGLEARMVYHHSSKTCALHVKQEHQYKEVVTLVMELLRKLTESNGTALG